MPNHKFQIDQRVVYHPQADMLADYGGEYVVVRLLPVLGREPQYRIKSTSDAHERMAVETELAMVTL